MDHFIPLRDLPQELYQILKEKNRGKAVQIVQDAMGTSYSNFSRRLNKNHIYPSELELIADRAGLKVKVEIEDMVFQNSGMTIGAVNEPVSAYGQGALHDKNQIIQLTKENGELKLENYKLSTENQLLNTELENLKKQLSL